MFKGKRANEYHQMLPYYIGKYEPKRNNFVFGSARENWMEEVDKMVVKRHFERINIRMEFKSYMKN